LEAPDLLYKAPDGMTGRRIGEMGSWNHQNFKFNLGKNLSRWVVINYASRARDDSIYQFVDTLKRIGGIHGMLIDEPLEYLNESRNSREESVMKTFDNLVVKHKTLELVFVILPGTSRVYNAIKTSGDMKYGIATQAVEEKNVSRLSDQTVSNILLKINTKLGGKNFVLSANAALFKQHLSEFFAKPIMMFGADVTHPAPGDTQVTESLAAVVGSFDRDCSIYGARLFAQKTPKGQAYEMIHDLDKMFISLLQQFFATNKTFPQRIVFFRDGVSEGQFSLVIMHVFFQFFRPNRKNYVSELRL
jgi:eukaryotic translation initiation factor 2C